MKPVLKEPGSKRLKLQCDEPLSNSAFNSNLRRYNKVKAGHRRSRYTCGCFYRAYDDRFRVLLDSLEGVIGAGAGSVQGPWAGR
jgi:hypothetical protein